ncbi:SH2 domain-containing protein 5 [Geodia barretti]|uniref:SH2 domain-containing protein 5 n=2 Tax=Geodia barretti TaxID=519541 RepID=A0AA35T2T7_GEOBA|nr:SH2 domain-containing protein 5 [Geodia barretti]
MYALKARDKYYKREKEREEEKREGRKARSVEQHAHHHSSGANGGGGERGRRKEPSTFQKDAKYMGTFSLQMGSGWKKNMTKPVKQQLSRINPKDTTHAVDVTVSVNMDGVKVISTDGRLVMAHALHRILLSSAETRKSLFAMVARNPQTDPKDGVYCHIFLLRTKEEANELSQLVGKAFKTAFACNSFKRDSKKQSSILDSMPPHLPSAAPRPWTVTTPPQSGHSPQTTPPGHTHQLEPISRPPPAVNPAAVTPGVSSAQEESVQLEMDLLSLHSQLYQLETRQSHLTSSPDNTDEGTLLQLVMEISSLQQQIEEKGKRLHSLQQQPSGSHSDTVAEATGGGYQDDAMAMLPDFDSLSLDDADWFQAGLPREIVVELLSQQPEGAFFVRESASSLGSYALSMVAPDSGVRHFLIEERDGHFSLSLTGSGVLTVTECNPIYPPCTGLSAAVIPLPAISHTPSHCGGWPPPLSPLPSHHQPCLLR